MFNFSKRTDINECLIQSDTCHSNAFCANTNGSYKCTCSDGYSGNGRICLGNEYLTLNMLTQSCLKL